MPTAITRTGVKRRLAMQAVHVAARLD